MTDVLCTVYGAQVYLQSSNKVFNALLFYDIVVALQDHQCFTGISVTLYNGSVGFALYMHVNDLIRILYMYCTSMIMYNVILGFTIIRLLS